MTDLCISSLVVRTKPANLDAVRGRLEAMPDVEIFGENEDGRLVVVVDTTNTRKAADTFTDIQNQPDVLSATLIYQYDDHLGSQVEDPV